MAEIEAQKKMELRWSQPRMQSIKSLGWQHLDSSAAVDRSFNMAEELDKIIRIYDRFLSGDANLGELMKSLNRARQYK